MVDSKKSSRDPFDALLRLSEEYEQTPEEAEVELRAAGVDVDGFVVRMKARLAEQAELDRLAWLRKARADRANPTPVAIPEKYRVLDRTALIASLQNRPSFSAQAQTFFHKLDEVKDDDLRTLLVDLDDLDADDKDPA